MHRRAISVVLHRGETLDGTYRFQTKENLMAKIRGPAHRLPDLSPGFYILAVWLGASYLILPFPVTSCTT